MYTACIIGLGSIGADKPDLLDDIGSPNILTHAHACYNHPKISKFIGNDIDGNKRNKFLNKWKSPVYFSYDPLWLQNHHPDILIISVPTILHRKIFIDAFNFKEIPKVIILEKPAGINWREAQDIKIFSERYKIPIIVDYIRRFDPYHQKVAYDIRNGEYGKIYNARIFYTRGLKHECCHGIDLCNWFFGKYKTGRIVNDLPIIHEMDNDPSYTVIMKYEKCDNVQLIPMDGRKYSIFEFDIMTEIGRHVFSEHGLYHQFYPVEKEKTYGNYNTLSDKVEYFDKTDLNVALYNLIDNAINVIEGKARPLCSIDDAINVHKIYEDLIK